MIARPGPYINAEVDGGGFPGWLSTTAGNTRTGDPEYLKYSDEWQTQIDRIIARHQLTDGGGTVIGYQVENEYYNGNTAGHAYMQHIGDKASADGITVPLTGNNNGTFNSGVGALDVDGPDSYPQGFNCSTRRTGVASRTSATTTRPASRSTRRSSRAARSTPGVAPATTSARS